MRINELNGQNICILGFGREGRAMLQAIMEDAPNAEVTIADQSEAIEAPAKKHWLQTGTGWLKNLEKFDVIIRSPGIPPQPEFEAVKPKLTSATQIFLDTIEGSGATVIGVTGSKGKSTVASLITAILKAAGKDVSLIGNIGEPAISHRKEAFQNKTGGERSRTIFVQEMSSYQLQNLTSSPPIAVVTSFFPEHLDYHGSVEAYMEAKKNITRHQRPTDIVFYNVQNDGTKIIAALSPGRQFPVSEHDSPITLSETHLIGRHNLGNIALAAAVADYLNIERPVTSDAIRSFTPLPHRLQSLGVHHGLEWVDDSISTTPESTIAALDALDDHVKVLLLGGQDRGNDFSVLAQRIKESSVELVVLFPESGTRIRKALEQAGVKAKMQGVTTMDEAVALARTVQRGICLLSPASPSYNQYKNFEERGEAFADALTR